MQRGYRSKMEFEIPGLEWKNDPTPPPSEKEVKGREIELIMDSPPLQTGVIYSSKKQREINSYVPPPPPPDIDDPVIDPVDPRYRDLIGEFESKQIPGQEMTIEEAEEAKKKHGVPFGKRDARKVESGVILPLTTYDDGTTRVDWDAGIPGAVTGWFKTVQELIEGPPEDVADPDRWMAEKSFQATIGVYMGGSVVPVEGHALRSFGGIKGAAKLADDGLTTPLEAMQTALAMEKQGVPYDKILQETNKMFDRDIDTSNVFGGLSKGADGKWRLEFNDRAIWDEIDTSHVARLFTDPDQTPTQNYTQFALWELMPDDSALFVAYPQIKEMPVRVRRTSLDVSGEAHSVRAGISISAPDLDNLKDVMIHEVQHILQDIEGFPVGGSPRTVSMRYPEEYKKSKVKTDKEYNEIKDKLEEIGDRTKQLDAERSKLKDKEFKAYKYSAAALANKDKLKELFPSLKFDDLDQIHATFTREREAFALEAEKLGKEIKENWSEAEYYRKLLFKVMDPNMDVYKRLFGEVEARNAGRRRNMSGPVRRRQEPQNTEDYNRSDQIDSLTSQQWEERRNNKGR